MDGQNKKCLYKRRGSKKRAQEKLSNHQMENWKSWSWICLKRLSIVVPARGLLVRYTSHLICKSKAHKSSLMTLYEDMESLGEDEDIQVLWNMVHSSCPHYPHSIRGRRSLDRRSCFCL